MARTSWLIFLGILCMAAGCKRPEPSVDVIKQLSSMDPHIREEAASSLRRMTAQDAASIGDTGDAYWQAKLDSIPKGTDIDRVGTVLGAAGRGGEGGGGGFSLNYTLDDFHSVTGFFQTDWKTHESTFMSFSPLRHRAPVVELQPPPGFTGKWVTYFINGQVSSERSYARGKLVRITDHYDNAQVQMVSEYADEKQDGPYVTYFRNGTKENEGRYAAGKRIGPWVQYYENGKPYDETTYVNGEAEGPSLAYREDGTLRSRMDFHAGKETGQAAWDESGKLEYARGSTALDGGK